MNPDDGADLGEHPDLDPTVLDRGIDLVRGVYEVPTLRRSSDHIALHTIPVGGITGRHHVILSTTLPADRLAEALEQLADLIREAAG